jgi:hypothetical protein
VAFIRHSRDKRGFESLYVMHAYRPMPDAPHRTRVLYLFRSPAQLRVGRQPLDSEVREALEHTHPDISFDWNALNRERAAPRYEAPDRAARRQGSQRPPPAHRQAPADDSVLGRVLGAGQAAGLRRRYAELSDRVARRARTPEERDRLQDRLKRLNPDDWADEASVRAGFRTIHADLSAISGELPGRRRGRRGGRRQDAGMEAGPAGPSAIMGEDGPHDEAEASAPVDWPSPDASDSGERRERADADAPPGSAEDAGLHDDDRAHHD